MFGKVQPSLPDSREACALSCLVILGTPSDQQNITEPKHNGPTQGPLQPRALFRPFVHYQKPILRIPAPPPRPAPLQAYTISVYQRRSAFTSIYQPRYPERLPSLEEEVLAVP